MCLVVFAYGVHPHLPLVVAANRDEFYERPSAPAAFWPEAPGLLAGRDVRAGGTWMGISRSGRFAALTNFRDPRAQKAQAPSRGPLVSGFLRADEPPLDWLETLRREAGRYNPFNLLAGDPAGLFFLSSRTGAVEEVAPGIHGLSNALLDTPWPKVLRTRDALHRLLRTAPDPLDAEELLAILLDRTVAADPALPDTGVGVEWERALSPPFIATPLYGTRSSTALTIGIDGTARLLERTFDPRDGGSSTVGVELRVPRWTGGRPFRGAGGP